MRCRSTSTARWTGQRCRRRSLAGLAGPPPALTVAEQEVARLWQELLGVENLDIESHFFQLGAHSLTATRLTSQVNERFGIELPVSVVFAAPRLREFARVVEDAVLRDIIERRRHEQGGS